MGEQQSRLRTQVWCQNTCQNCMSGAGDIDNAVAAQTELNRRNGAANGPGTIIPREELQKLLKQQTLLPSSQQQKVGTQQMPPDQDKNLGESSLDLYVGKASASHLSSKRADLLQQQRLQSFSSPNDMTSRQHPAKDAEVTTLRPTGPSGLNKEQLLSVVPESSQAAAIGSNQHSSQHCYTSDGASKRYHQSRPQVMTTAQQNNRSSNNPLALSHIVAEAVHPQVISEPNNHNFQKAPTKNSTISSPPPRALNFQGQPGGGGGNGANVQNVMEVHHSQLREAQRVQRQTRMSKKQLNLRVLSSAFLQKGQVITIDEHGLASEDPLRRAYDGVTYFGCKRTLPKQLVHGSGEMEADSGAPATIHEPASDDEANSSVALDSGREVVNDFIIPACKKEDKGKHAGRQFQIRFDPYTETYFIKDLQIGYGVFTETVGPVPLKDNLLINMGESYIVTNLCSPEPEIVQEYALNGNSGANQTDASSLAPPKLKLRVFSVSRSDQPDLFCCQFEEQEVVIGRSPNCDIRVDDELLSKMQASISFDLASREWVLQDGYQGKRSTNGTWLYLNEEIPVQSGMLFKSNQTFFQATVE